MLWYNMLHFCSDVGVRRRKASRPSLLRDVDFPAMTQFWLGKPSCISSLLDLGMAVCWCACVCLCYWTVCGGQCALFTELHIDQQLICLSFCCYCSGGTHYGLRKEQGRLLWLHHFFHSTCHRPCSFPEAGKMDGSEPVLNLTAAILAMLTQSHNMFLSLVPHFLLLNILTNIVCIYFSNDQLVGWGKKIIVTYFDWN